MSDIDQYNLEDLKKLLYNHNMLDDAFIDQDVPSSTGQIFNAPIDADINISKADKEMAKRLLLMQSAVEKIYKGYLNAYNKDTYKKQFDIYPLKDFEEHMASLGAVRSNNGLDFEPAPGTEVVDWIALVDKERNERNVEYNKKQDEIAKEKLEKEADESKDLQEKQKELEKNNEGGKVGPIQQEEINKEKEKKDLTDEDINRLSKLSTKKLKERVKELNKQQDENPDATQNDEISREIKDLQSKIREIEKQLNETIQGRKLDPKKQKFITENLETNTWTVKTNKQYSGFTTQGPFCIQKRNYFRNIFRPSIQHFDTEFREAVQTRVASKDEQTSKTIQKLKLKKGSIKVPEKTTTDNSIANDSVKSVLDGDEKLKQYYDLLPEETKKALNDLDMAIQALYRQVYDAYTHYFNTTPFSQETQDLLKGVFPNPENAAYISKIIMYGLIGYSRTGQVSGVELNSVKDAFFIVYTSSSGIYTPYIKQFLNEVLRLAGKTEFAIKDFFKGIQ